MSSILLSASQYCSLFKNVTPSLVGKLLLGNRNGFHNHSQCKANKSILSKVDEIFSIRKCNPPLARHENVKAFQIIRSGSGGVTRIKYQQGILGRLIHRNGEPTIFHSNRLPNSQIPVTSCAKDKGYLNIPTSSCDLPLIETESSKLRMKQWSDSCLQASILNSIIGILKLLVSLVVELIKALYRIVRSLLGDQNKKKLDDATSKAKMKADEMNKQYGPEVQKGLDKTKAAIQTELPKIKDKLETKTPEMKKNINEFTDKFGNEMKKAKNPAEKREKAFGMFFDLIQSNKIYQALVVFLFLYFVFCVLRWFFSR